MLFLPVFFFLFGVRVRTERGPFEVLVVALVATVAALALHVRLADAPPGVVLASIGIGTVLLVPVAFGVFFLLLSAGGCNDDGHVPPVAWIGAILVYLAGGAWGLQRPGRGVWAVPCSLLASGLWLVGVSVALTGSTGACLD
jgi:hypothetical protein